MVRNAQIYNFKYLGERFIIYMLQVKRLFVNNGCISPELSAWIWSPG